MSRVVATRRKWVNAHLQAYEVITRTEISRLTDEAATPGAAVRRTVEMNIRRKYRVHDVICDAPQFH